MEKEIISKDLVRINELLKQELQIDGYRNIIRLGGLTNHTYSVECNNGENYVIRIPGEGTEKIINRKNEKISTELACRLNIDTELLYFGQDGEKITRYIKDAVTMNPKCLKEHKRIRQAAHIFKVLHSSGIDTGVPFEVFDMAKGYENIIFDNQVVLYDNYIDVKNKVMQIKAEIDEMFEIKNVPCHNDPLCENWIESNGRLYLIDWEYAGMNDGMWDLADLSIEAEYNEEQDLCLLELYLEKNITIYDRKRFLANKIYLDFLWTLWGKTRVPYEGNEMEVYAHLRYNRLAKNIDLYYNQL